MVKMAMFCVLPLLTFLKVKNYFFQGHRMASRGKSEEWNPILTDVSVASVPHTAPGACEGFT